MPIAWTPLLADGPAALYDKILSALERDIRSGQLAGGVRLPPQRELAFALGVSVGTVTKAYVEAELRGLVEGQVGRGTFVAHGLGPRAADEVESSLAVDLSINNIPLQLAAKRMAESLSSAKGRADYLDILACAPAMGFVEHRLACATWLGRIAGLEVDASRVIMGHGAQHAMSLVLGHLAAPGDTVLCEAATYFGLKALAEHGRFSLRGVGLDEQGLRPDALERAARQTGAKVLFAMPTAQNPTGRTMSQQRRRDIAEVARRCDLWVIEDDVYGLFWPGMTPPTPLAALIPERVFYLSGVSKALAPGLRTGFTLCPTGDHFQALVRTLQATMRTGSSYGDLFFTQWVEDGSAFEIALAVRQEIAERVVLARDILDLPPSPSQAPHIWLELSELQSERLVSRAARAGVLLTPADASIVAGDPICGVRVCLGGPSTRDHLTVGLRRLASAMTHPSDFRDVAMV